MSTIFWKNLLKCLPTTIPNSSEVQDHTHSMPPPISPTSTTSNMMIKNFNSIYDLSSSSTSKSLTTNSFSSSTDAEPDSDSDSDSSPPDFSTIYASQRFFFSSPGRSNSIIQSSDILPEESKTTTCPLTGGGVAIKKYSPNPYEDFKHSMKEMIEAREIKDVRANWDYLHELLSCYLTLNPKNTHRFIISAFSDIIICLLSKGSDQTHRNNKQGDRRRHEATRWVGVM